jgi:hypothetical protein
LALRAGFAANVAGDSDEGGSWMAGGVVAVNGEAKGDVVMLGRRIDCGGFGGKRGFDMSTDGD